MARMYQILMRPTKACDEYTPVKWSFVAYGARFTKGEADEYIKAYARPDHKYRLIAI